MATHASWHASHSHAGHTGCLVQECHPAGSGMPLRWFRYATPLVQECPLLATKNTGPWGPKTSQESRQPRVEWASALRGAERSGRLRQPQPRQIPAESRAGTCRDSDRSLSVVGFRVLQHSQLSSYSKLQVFAGAAGLLGLFTGASRGKATCTLSAADVGSMHRSDGAHAQGSCLLTTPWHGPPIDTSIRSQAARHRMRPTALAHH